MTSARARLALLVAVTLVPLSGVASPVTAEGTHTGLFMIGEPGSGAAANKIVNAAPPTMRFRPAYQGNVSEQSFFVEDPDPPMDSYWHLRFASPEGTPLTVGTYLDAQRVPFRQAGHPGIEISGNSVTCGSTNGQFTIHELERAEDGLLTVFSVTFAMYCADQPTPGALVIGELRFNSQIGWSGFSLDPQSLAFPLQPVGTTSDAATVSITSTGSDPLTVDAAIGGVNPSDFTLASDDCDVALATGESCTLGVSFAPTVSGPRLATLQVAVSGYPVSFGLSLSGGGRTPTGTILQAPSGIGMYPSGVLMPVQVSPNTAGGTLYVESGGQNYGGASVSQGSGQAYVIAPPGDSQVRGHFLTNSTYFQSLSDPIGITFKAATRTLLAAGPDMNVVGDTTVFFGELVELYARVECVGSYPLTGGRLTITDRATGQTLASTDFSGSQVLDARAVVRVLQTAVYTFDAAYSGNGLCAASSDSIQVGVLKYPTRLVLSLPAVAHYPGPTNIEATVGPVPDGGTVTFRDGATALGTVPVSAADGQAVLSVTLSPGTRSITADYSGSAAFTTASATAQSLKVSIATAVDVSADPEQVNAGVQVTLSGTLRAIGTGAPGIGELQMWDTSTNEFLASAPVTGSNHQVSQTLTFVQGIHQIEVRYGGSGDYDPSVGTVTLDVGPASTDSQAPAGAVTINGGNTYTNNPQVALVLSATDPVPGTGVTQMRLSGVANAWPLEWEPYTTQRDWTLTGADGPKQIYVQFRDGAGNLSAVASAGVVLDSQSPDPPVPVESVQLGGSVGSQVPITVSYTTSDAVSPVSRYLLGQSTNGGSTYTSVPISPLQSSVTRTLAPGSTLYRFRSRATDSAGNQSPWSSGPAFTITMLQDQKAAFAYSGKWTVRRNASASGGRLHEAAALGAAATVSFTGTEAAVVARVGPDCGRAGIYADGVLVRTVDLYSPTKAWRKVVAVIDFAQGGPHEITVRALGAKSSLSSGTKVPLDALVVLR